MPDYIEARVLEQMPEVANVRHRFVTVNGVRLHVAEAGDAEAPAVLLLHGFPQHWYMWRHVMEPLARTRHVVAVDFRGFGWSEASASGYSMADRVHDVLVLMDELGVCRADLVGHDWGALVAAYVALDHPDRVRRLVAISMLHLWPLQRFLAPSTWRWWVTSLFEWPGLGSWILRNRPRVTGWLLARDAVRPDIWTDSLREKYVARSTEPARALAGQRLHAQLILGMPRLLLGRDRNRRYDVPTLILGGASDALIPPAVLTVPRSRADAIKLRIVPGGHYVVDENPEQVTEAVLDHLTVSSSVVGSGADAAQ